VAPVALPTVQVTLTRSSAGTLKLNGTGADGYADSLQWSSEVNGGHKTASFRIPQSFLAAHRGIVRYGTRCEFKVASGPDNGTVIFTGYLLSVPDATTPDLTVNAVGYQQLVHERTDAMLWQSAHIQDWVSTNGAPFGIGFACANGIQESVNPGFVGFRVDKGSTVKFGDDSTIGWWFGPDVTWTRLAGTISKNSTVPGGSANWWLRVCRYDGPTNFASRGVVDNFASLLDTTNFQDTFVSTPAVARPVCTLELLHTAGTTTPEQLRIWINDLRISGDAYRGGRTPSDTYQGHNPVLDLAADLGFTTGKVATVSTSCLPLWHQSGPWTDVFEHLSHLFTGANGWKWGVWDIVGGAPEVEFRDYATSNTTWTVSGYGTNANAAVNLQTAQNDLHAKVVVTYRHAGSPRLLRKTAAITPNPFTGLDPWMQGRQRAFHYHIPDPQPASSTLPQTAATNLAADFSNEQWEGTIDVAYANDGSNDRSGVLIRAGQLVRISDFPGGAKTLRIESVDGVDKGPITLHIGRRPHSIERLIWKQHERLRRRALHHIHA
jgi:hypothetical protein